MAQAQLFFQDPLLQEALKDFNRELNKVPQSAISPPGLKGITSVLIEFFIGGAQSFDEYTRANISWIGKRFASEIRDFSQVPLEQKSETLQFIFGLCFRFSCEFQLFFPGEPAMEFRQVNDYVAGAIKDFSPNNVAQINYALYSMPVEIIRQVVRHPDFPAFQNFSSTVESAKLMKDEWDKGLESKKNTVDQLAQRLSQIASEYNFVLLVDAFKNLRKRKEEETSAPFFVAIALAIAMLALPALHYWAILGHVDFFKQNLALTFYTLPAVLAAEILLVYLFRVVLSQFRSVKAQLLQLDLRIALCQFVQSYAEYAGSIRKTDASILAKFEALIFSGLVTDQNDIPSTFDGVEQIASLIKSVQSRP